MDSPVMWGSPEGDRKDTPLPRPSHSARPILVLPPEDFLCLQGLRPEVQREGHFQKDQPLTPQYAYPGYTTMAIFAGLVELSPSVPHLLWLLPLLYVLSVAIYRVWLHPLSKYPGPLLSKITPILPILKMVQRKRLHWQYEMLNQYGSPVRVAHNELLFGDAKSWVDIYGQSSNPCLKEAKFYDAFTVTGTASLLNERNRLAHARLRRLVSHTFSLNALLKDEHIIRQKANELVQHVFAPAAKNGVAVDIFNKVNEHYLDIISYLGFGESFNTVKGQSEITQEDMDQLYVVLSPYIPCLPPPQLCDKSLVTDSRLPNSQYGRCADAVILPTTSISPSEAYPERLS